MSLTSEVKVGDMIDALTSKEISYPATYLYCDMFMQEKGGYIGLAGTFLSEGNMGCPEDKDFYHWLEEGESEALKKISKLYSEIYCQEDCIGDFAMRIFDRLNGGLNVGKKRPNQKWHFLISYLAMKEYFSTKRFGELCERYPKKANLKKWKIELEEGRKFLELPVSGGKLNVNNYGCMELKLWILEALGVEGTDEVKNELVELAEKKAPGDKPEDGRGKVDSLIVSLWKKKLTDKFIPGKRQS